MVVVCFVIRTYSIYEIVSDLKLLTYLYYHTFAILNWYDYFATAVDTSTCDYFTFIHHTGQKVVISWTYSEYIYKYYFLPKDVDVQLEADGLYYFQTRSIAIFKNSQKLCRNRGFRMAQAKTKETFEIIRKVHRGENIFPLTYFVNITFTLK